MRPSQAALPPERDSNPHYIRPTFSAIGECGTDIILSGERAGRLPYVIVLTMDAENRHLPMPYVGAATTPGNNYRKIIYLNI